MTKVRRMRGNDTAGNHIHANEHRAVMHIIIGMIEMIPTTMNVIACHLTRQVVEDHRLATEGPRDSISQRG